MKKWVTFFTGESFALDSGTILMGKIQTSICGDDIFEIYEQILNRERGLHYEFCEMWDLKEISSH